MVSALNSTLSIEDADRSAMEEVIDGLLEQGFKRRDAEVSTRATFKPGSSFSDAFRDALTHATKTRGNGAPKLSTSRKCLCGCGEDLPPDSKWAYIYGHGKRKESPAGEANVRGKLPVAPTEKLPAATQAASAGMGVESPSRVEPDDGDSARSRAIPAITAPALREENKIEVSEFELDMLWAQLPLARKAALLFGRKEPA